MIPTGPSASRGDLPIPRLRSHLAVLTPPHAACKSRGNVSSAPICRSDRLAQTRVHAERYSYRPTIRRRFKGSTDGRTALPPINPIPGPSTTHPTFDRSSLYSSHSSMPSSSSSSSSSSKAAEEAKRLKEEKHKRDATSSKKEQARAKYQKEAARGTTTVDELVGVADLEKNFFTEGEWQPAWAHVEFVSRPRSAERYRQRGSCPGRRCVLEK